MTPHSKFGGPAYSPEHEYLAIKNWEKYQSLRKSGKWIKDYVDQLDDPAISKLTIFQRAVLQDLRRLRGRLGKNIPNDPYWITMAMSVLPQERHNAMSSISQLVVKGFLIPTNQQHTVPDSGEKEKEKEIKKEKKKEPSATRDVLPQDSRHQRIKALVMNAYQEQNHAECPWNGGEGKQLKELLDSTPRWSDSQISQCLSNLFDSQGFAKGTRPREWLARLPRYLNGPLNQFNRDTQTVKSKAQERHDENDEKYRKLAAQLHARDGGNLSLQNDSRGTASLLGLAAPIPDPGSERGRPFVDAESVQRVVRDSKTPGFSEENKRAKGAAGGSN